MQSTFYLCDVLLYFILFYFQLSKPNLSWLELDKRPIEFGRHGDPPFGAGAGPGCLRRQLREQMLPGVRSFGFTVQGLGIMTQDLGLMFMR